MTAMRTLIIFSLFLLAMLCSGAVSAKEIYKWVDENGVVNFSEKAPASKASGLSRFILEDTTPAEQGSDDDPFNVEATAARMQAYRDSMEQRREAQRKARLERERIAAQRPVIQYQQVGYRNTWPWYAHPPLRPVPPIEPPPPVVEPYPSVPFRPPGRPD
jgi:hypothetical protein